MGISRYPRPGHRIAPLADLRTSHEATLSPEERTRPVQTIYYGKVPETIIFQITASNLNEGGRRRKGEAYLNIDRAKAAFFGVRDITIVTDDGLDFPAKLTGRSGLQTPKNLRSRPARMLGEWLIERHQACPGDQVHVKRLDNDRFLFRFVKNPIGAPSQTPLDANSEDNVRRSLRNTLDDAPEVLCIAELDTDFGSTDTPGGELVADTEQVAPYRVVEVESLIASYNALVSERDVALAERDATLPERDAALAKRNAALSERDAALVERDVALAEQDAALVKRDAVLAERDAALAKVNRLMAGLDSYGINVDTDPMFRPAQPVNDDPSRVLGVGAVAPAAGTPSQPPRFVLFDVFPSSDTLTIGVPTQSPPNARIARELAGILTQWSSVVLLDGEIRALRDIPGAEKISASDPRLGHLLQQFSLGATTVQELGDRLSERSHAPLGPEVVVRLRRLREAAQVKKRLTLEEELRDMVVGLTGHSERTHLIVARYLGWDGRGGATLQAVGDEFGMSRERVRQIYAPVAKALAATKPFAPALDRVLSVVEERVPAPASAIEKSLVAEGLTAAPFPLEGVIKAAEVLGRQVPFVITGASGNRMVLPPRMKTVANEIIRCARKSVEHWGVATVEDITAQVMEQLPEPVHSDFVTQVLQSNEDFQWLDEAGDWFWLSSVTRNRLLNRINKVLSVSPRINVAELRAGVAREYRMQGVVPPQRVLLELCRQAAGYLVEGSTVSADPPVAWWNILSETEQILLLALETHGPVMRRAELEELCVGLGIKRSTFYVRLGYSPFIAQYARGVYGLRGADVEPGLVESLIAPRRRGRVLKDYGWTTDGSVWLGFQLSEAMISSGTFTVPTAMKSFVRGEFLLKAEDGSSMGTAVVQESWSWGLGPFFRRRGGKPGDHLILVFDLAVREAVVHIGDADLLDQFQALNEEEA